MGGQHVRAGEGQVLPQTRKANNAAVGQQQGEAGEAVGMRAAAICLQGHQASLGKQPSTTKH